jgi:mannose-6-phosphate isomerase-like protein (cupin superfamily)
MDQIQVQRWHGGQHPSLANITRILQDEGLRPYISQNNPNTRQAVRSHGYDKVLYVLDGALEIILPDSNQRLVLRSGDRLNVPSGVRHGTICHRSVTCIEAAVTSGRSRARR